jgi:hypothetical protein
MNQVVATTSADLALAALAKGTLDPSQQRALFQQLLADDEFFERFFLYLELTAAQAVPGGPGGKNFCRREMALKKV